MAAYPTKHKRLFLEDEDAYMLEAARIYPPVAGMNPAIAKADTTITLANGKTATFKV